MGGSAARCGLLEKAPWLSSGRAGGFLALEFHVRAVRCAFDLTLGAVCRPPGVFGGATDADIGGPGCLDRFFFEISGSAWGRLDFPAKSVAKNGVFFRSGSGDACATY